MLYIDTLTPAVFNAFSKRRDKTLYLNDMEYFTFSYLPVIATYSFKEESMRISDLNNFIKSGVDFENLSYDYDRGYYIQDPLKSQPVYVRNEDYIILHRYNDLYIGFDTDWYLHFYIEKLSISPSGYTMLRQEHNPSTFTFDGDACGIRFPIMSKEQLKINVLVKSLKGYTSSVLNFNELEDYAIYKEDVAEWLKIKHKSLIRQSILGGRDI